MYLAPAGHLVPEPARQAGGRLATIAQTPAGKSQPGVRQAVTIASHAYIFSLMLVRSPSHFGSMSQFVGTDPL
jgi:hypothetical protein